MRVIRTIGSLLVGGSPEGLVDDRLLPSQTGGRDGCGGTSIADADATGWSAQDTPDEVVDPGRCRPLLVWRRNRKPRSMGARR